MTNPYATPGSELLDAETGKRRRPLLVWFITAVYGFGGIGSMVNAFLFASGEIHVPEPYRSALLGLGPLLWILGVIGGVLMLGFCMALFRLRSGAVRWCEALLAFSVANTAFQLGGAGLPPGTLGLFTLASTALGFGILAAIYLYSRRLRSRAVLV